jgi:uncharacterized protein YndB with AHSA1/START domain
VSQSQTVPDTTLRMSRVFKATPERVFRAFVDAEAMRVWFCPTGFSFETVTVDRATGRGSLFVMVDGATGDRFAFALDYTLIDPPHKIEWISTWRDGFPEPGRETMATIEFREVPGGTEVTLTQHGFLSRENRDEHANGWGGGMDKLAMYLSAER